ncbi:MAG TPA: ABC transporter substrate-binding protein [Terriglobales bacterium]|nr:ABC transporter substrate-binding protein [Terriglobales bacterium]
MKDYANTYRHHHVARPFAVGIALAFAFSTVLVVNVHAQANEELFSTSSEVGRSGGVLVVAQRVEPKTLNPVMALDVPSRDIIWRMMADLVHINRHSQQTEPALAKAWKISPDGRRYTVNLRRGIRFSDGHPFDADDVVFSFQIYMDEKVGSPQRDLLLPGGKPIVVRKLDQYTVEFQLAQPYGPAERLFDSIAILPRHVLEKTYQQGAFADAWRLDSKPETIVGLGPFRLKEYAAGTRVVLERNPYYWKADRTGKRLPYLERLTFLFVGTDDAQVMRFQAGETDIINRIGAENYAVLSKNTSGTYRLYDVGPGLEYNFVFFNLNDVGQFPRIASKQTWFREVNFRRAVSAVIDREAIAKIVYRGNGSPLWGPVTPGNKLWLNAELPKPSRNLDHAKAFLKSSGFSWAQDGTLLAPNGERVAFSIVVAAGNAPRVAMATMVQEDLGQLGMRVDIVPMEFRAMVDRITKTYEYEAALMGIGSGDVDPASEINVWLSTGSTHLWHLHETQPATYWEAEIDRLMQQQLATVQFHDRKQLYDRVQLLIAENLPIICLATPDILVGAKTGIGNFRPANLDHYTLWNVEELFWVQ